MNEVVTYSYDSWGKLLNIGGSLADTVGKINPFRYRGYYYDSETGLYYLQSRYYDANVGRFINSDGLVSDGLLGTNSFTYCNNNPSNCIDPDGRFCITLTILLITAIVLTVTAVAATVAYAYCPPVQKAFNEFCSSVCSSVSNARSNVQSKCNKVKKHVQNISTVAPACICAATIPLAVTAEKAISKPKEITKENNKKDIRFPANPDDFNPRGLQKCPYPGTKNGRVTKWKLGEETIFEWDENTKHSDGPHYHIGDDHKDAMHYYTNYEVPEPYASLYFGG